MRPHVLAGRCHRMEEGQIQVDSVPPITLDDITPELARASGVKGVVELLKVAKHRPGENLYLVRFHYVPPEGIGKPRVRGQKTACAPSKDPRRGHPVWRHGAAEQGDEADEARSQVERGALVCELRGCGATRERPWGANGSQPIAGVRPT